ncbi:Forkhead box protein C1-B OS=Xenopus laevis GN=foxc1-b PE=2 SV=1 [Rhizoctonia solani AG-1 IB]|uniref:Forkhead box protein C1-B n=1 Tax=Thanatephorus cucumeris (strain AG1-IB / isolate 7/3/14) TaxID=1108050 RepID=A0A0B7FWE4_THACB|nr:Forkhead box protein C1-B OS=Xenopus laevis GN=foxc1-b PE=2 SV=1 [Rhizoctonia solani AG-1 IB]
MRVESTTTTSVSIGSSVGRSSYETKPVLLSPPISPEDLASLPRQRNKIIHQIQHRASPTDSSSSTTTTALSQTAAAPDLSIYRPSTPDTVRVKPEIASPSPSLGPSPSPSPSPSDDPDATLQPSKHYRSPQYAASEHLTEQKPNQAPDTPSSPTARALRSLGLTRADLAQHAQRMKSFLGAGGRRGFPSAAELASLNVKPEPTDSDMVLTQSSTSSICRQASVVSYTSSAYTTTTTDISRASSTYPNPPSTSTSFDTTPSRQRRTARGRPVLPPLPPSSPPPMLSPVRSGESNRTGINSSPIRSPLASPSQAGPSHAYAGPDYANPNDPPYTLPPAPRPREKPAASYAALIGQAIMSAIPGPDGKKKLTLAQIYAWISAAWPFYKPGEAGWMNSIRHNLSLNDCFVKIKRDGREKGKGSFWGIREGDEDMFANGGFVRRNSAAKKRKKEPTPAREEPETRPAPEPMKRARTNTAPVPPSYIYEPPHYPPLPGASRQGVTKASAAAASAGQPPKRTRAAPATSANKKPYRSPVGDHVPSSSPARAESGKRGQRQEYQGDPPELTPNMSSSPDIPASSPISSSPPPQSTDGGSAERPAVPEYSTKSGLMDMVINNSAKKRKVSGSSTNPNRLGALGNGSPVMKRRPNGSEEEPRTIYPASMLNRPGSPTQHINPRATLKTRNEQHTRRDTPPVTRPNDLCTSSRGSEPVTPPRTLEKPSLFGDSGGGGLDRPQFVALKPSDIIPTTPPRTLAPLTVATSAERTPLSHAAFHMSPSRPSDLSHFKTSLHPPSNEFTTPLLRRVPSFSGIMLAMPTESPLRTPLGYGGARDINDLNSGCAEELMMTPASRLAIAGTAPGNEQSPSMLFGGMYRSPDGTWGPRPHW